MEERTFKKDITPYLVFQCSKCTQFSYVKITQKSKKCLRCGRTHQVKNILKIGEIVYGISTAVITVQQKQKEIGLNKSDGHITFSSNKDFKVVVNSEKLSIRSQHGDYSEVFYDGLKTLFQEHKRFPQYMIEIMAQTHKIPAKEVKLLIREFQNKGDLILLNNKDYYYTLKKDNQTT